MTSEQWRSEFADFLDRLAAAKGHVGTAGWSRFMITHYPDEEIEDMRRSVVRFSINWRSRDWPELNCELISGWAKKLRMSAAAPGQS